MFGCQQIHLTDTGVCFLCMVLHVNLIIFYSVLQRIDIVQQLTGIPFESVVAVSGVVCSRPPAQENMVWRIVKLWLRENCCMLKKNGHDHWNQLWVNDLYLKVCLSILLCQVWGRYGCIPSEVTGECIVTVGRNCHMHLDMSPINAQDYAYYLQRISWASVWTTVLQPAACCHLVWVYIIWYIVQKQGSLAWGKLWVCFWYPACAFYMSLICILIHNSFKFIHCVRLSFCEHWTNFLHKINVNLLKNVKSIA